MKSVYLRQVSSCSAFDRYEVILPLKDVRWLTWTGVKAALPWSGVQT